MNNLVLTWFTHDGIPLKGSFPYHSLTTIKTLAIKQRMYCIATNKESEYRIDPRGNEIVFFPWEMEDHDE